MHLHRSLSESRTYSLPVPLSATDAPIRLLKSRINPRGGPIPYQLARKRGNHRKVNISLNTSKLTMNGGKSKFLWTLSMNALSCHRGSSSAVRSISTSPIMCQSTNGGVNDNNSHESADDFERRIFSRFLNNDPNANSFYQKLDKLEKARGKMGADDSQLLDGLGDGFDTLSDGMDDKLKKAATTFVYSDEMKADDYAFRPDVNFLPGMEYSPKDLDLRNPVYRKPLRRPGFETTTAEVLKKADFRNVRFLANFITESGIIIKRRKTGISAKAQRKVAREIKTARAFGRMPFTTMGTKTFIFGKTMEDTEEDYEFDKSGPRFTGAKETPF